MFDKIDQLAVNTIRTLSIDMVQKANSGHPGLPMGASPAAYTLWSRHLKINPATARNWSNRDRFVLSAGHGSAMLYSLLHLAGFKVSIDDLKQFRQWNSKTPGHPEVDHTDGVEATTGPLGQGMAMAIGMAMAEAHLAATYNKPDFKIMDHYTYTLVGDGDLMEGVSQEAASLAGHLKLGKMIALYDANDISLDGPTSKSFTENVGERFKAYGWQHILVEDGNDLEVISKAIALAKETLDRPTLIEIKTIIGFGAPKQGTSSVHGAPLGKDGMIEAKKVYGWTYPDFTVPEEVASRFKESVFDKGAKEEKAWNTLFVEYKKAYPQLAEQYEKAFAKELPEGWQNNLPSYKVGVCAASRVTSKEMLQVISKILPPFWGGSADLSASNNTMVAAETDFESNNYKGHNIWFGVREFAMAAAMNGIALHGGTLVYGGTFFVFSNYLLPAIRLAAMQKLPVIYVLTHDSVAVGEDGPTHEPIEQLASLRSMPNLSVIRPADGNEVAAAWELAVKSKTKPTALILSRQNLPVLDGTKEKARKFVAKGAYVISPAQKEVPDGILLASGSEVNLAILAQKALQAKGQDISVVSMPSMDLFDAQSDKYKASVLPKKVHKRVAIEAGASFGWAKYFGLDGASVTLDHFGASAPGEVIFEKFGFTVEKIVQIFEQL
ncbi:MAG: transketolase [Streptococcaceae bacterium]|nr:transketolase [Streptococcaceae bacterium]